MIDQKIQIGLQELYDKVRTHVDIKIKSEYRTPLLNGECASYDEYRYHVGVLEGVKLSLDSVKSVTENIARGMPESEESN